MIETFLKRNLPATHLLAFLVAGCFFMEMLDTTIVTTAAPHIAADLGVEPRDTGVLITAYLISLAVFIPLGGWLLTRVRARTIFGAAIALFTVASLGCGAADSLVELLAFRVAQGIGGALMVPVGRQLVLRDADRADIQRLMAYIVWPGLAAPVIAPLLGGLITTHASWHWIFLINVPLGALALLAALRLVPADVEGPPRPFDWLGFGLTATSLGSLTWAGYLIGDGAGVDGWLWWVLAALALGVLGIAHLRRAAHPVLELAVLGDRTFAVSQLISASFWMVVMAVPYLLPLMLQVACGRSPVYSGTIVTFVFIGNIGIKPATGALLRRFSYRLILKVSVLGLALATAAIGLCPASTPAAGLCALALLSGVSRSVALTALVTIGFDTIPPSDRRAANTLGAVVTQVAGGLGVALATIGVGVGAAITGDPTSRATFTWAFLLVALVGALPAAAVWALPRGAGERLRVRRADPVARLRPRAPSP